jgi:hypothetical protein
MEVLMKGSTKTALLSVGLCLGVAAPAFAGEYDGRGNPVPGGVNGKSECSYSGRDVLDTVENNPPGYNDDALTGGEVQSYGRLVKLGLKGEFPSPGMACRGNVGH